MIYRIMAIACGCIGTMWSMELVWGVSDIFNGLMAVPNVIGVLVLWRKEVGMRSEELAKLTRVVHKHKVKVSTERSER